MDIIIEAFSVFLSWQNILVIGLGVAIGTIIGAIPGMTTPMGVALALPFTFTMPTVTGMFCQNQNLDQELSGFAESPLPHTP